MEKDAILGIPKIEYRGVLSASRAFLLVKK